VPAPRRTRGRRLLRIAESVLYPVLTLVLCFVAWQLVVVYGGVASYLLPKPTSIFATFYDQFPLILRNTWPTLEEIGLGYLLSIATGIPIAILIVASRIFEKSIYPILVASQTVPKVALAPLFLVWFGFGQTPKTLIAFMIAFFPIVIDTAIGLRSVPAEMIDLGRSMGASRIGIFLKVRFPFALPNVFAGLKVAITLAVIGAVVGEFVGADQGLGYLLVVANGRLDTTLLFATIMMLVLIGIVTFMAVDALERLAIPWHVSVRHQSARGA
jgi:NitT/TauT family transport system permease protein